MRQAAPDARVLSLRIMHSDDVVYEGDLLCALALLADRIAAAEDGSMAEMVDVVSLSLGYFDESAADVAYSSGLWQVIQVLLDLGVAVVAAAGQLLDHPPVLPGGVQPAAVAGPGDQRRRAQPERLQGAVQRRRPLGSGLGGGRGGGQQLSR